MPNPVLPASRAAKGARVGTLSASPLILSTAVRRTVDEVLLECNPHLERAGEVHSLRVAIARLRAGWMLIQHPQAGRHHSHLDRDLRWLRHKLGEVREWDVLEDDVLRKRQHRDDHRLQRRVARKRRKALHHARAAMGERRAMRLRDTLYRLRRDLASDGAEVFDAAERRALRAWAAPLVSALWDEMQIRVGKTQVDNPRDLHRLRLAIKALRYASEFVAPGYTTTSTTSFLARLAEVQHVLGTAHDACVEQQQLTRLAADAEEGRRSRPARASASICAAALRDLSRLTPFWMGRRPSRQLPRHD